MKIEKEIILNENFNIENITILDNDCLCLNNENSIKIYNLIENEFEFGFEMKYYNYNIKKIINLIDNNILIFYVDENKNNFLEIDKINKNNNEKIQNLEIDKKIEINDVIFLMCGKIILSQNLYLILFNYKLKKKIFVKENEIYVKNYNIKKIFEISNNLIVYSKTKNIEKKEKIEFYDFLKKKITKNIKMKINNFLLINLDFLLCFNENEVFIINIYKKILVSKFDFKKIIKFLF